MLKDNVALVPADLGQMSRVSSQRWWGRGEWTEDIMVSMNLSLTLQERPSKWATPVMSLQRAQKRLQKKVSVPGE